jgi:hypothetical protein
MIHSSLHLTVSQVDDLFEVSTYCRLGFRLQSMCYQFRPRISEFIPHLAHVWLLLAWGFKKA